MAHSPDRPRTSSTRSLVCALLVCGTVAPAHALPAGVDSPRTRTVIARATEAVRARGVLDRVGLLAEPPLRAGAVDVVYVLPRRSRANLAVRVDGAPDCAPLVQSIARINAQVEVLARSSTELLAAYDPLLARQVALAAEEARLAPELATAERARWAETALTLYEAELQRELARSDLPELTELYEAELALVKTQLEALATDSIVAAARRVAASIEAQRTALAADFDEVRERQRTRIAAAEEALSRVEAEHEELAKQPVATAEGTLPLFDAEVMTLLAQPDTARRLRFVPAQLENATLTIQDEGLPRDVPVWLELSSPTPRASTGPGEREPLPGLTPRPVRTRGWLVDEAAAIRREQVTYVDAQGASQSREVGVLQQAAPRVSAVLPLDAYCGALQRFVVSIATRADSGRTVALKMEQLTLTPRTDTPIETYTVSASYEVRVQAEPMPIACTLGAGGGTMPPMPSTTGPALERVALGSRLLSCRGFVTTLQGVETPKLLEAELKRAIQASARFRVGVVDGPMVSSTPRAASGPARTSALSLCTIDRCVLAPSPVLTLPVAWHQDEVRTTLNVEIVLPAKP